jgi:hypothetical protein
MPDQVCTKYVVWSLVILFISMGGNGYLGRGGYLGIERAGTGGRGRKGELGVEWCEGWGSRVLSPYCVLRYSSVIVEEGTIVRVAEG